MKANKNKFAAFPVDLREGADVDEVRALLNEELAWSLVYLEGLPDILQAQEFVTMEYEYRISVVDQRAVTGLPDPRSHLISPTVVLVRLEDVLESWQPRLKLPTVAVACVSA